MTVFDRKIRAFTLVELIIVLSVAAILLAIAVPSFTDFIKNGRLTTQINALVSALHITRSEAIKRAANVTLCASNDQATCAGGWKDGWLIYFDENGDGNVDASEIILVHYALPAGMTLNYNDTVNSITYEASGYAYKASTFLLCDERGAGFGKGLDLSRTGRPRVGDIHKCI